MPRARAQRRRASQAPAAAAYVRTQRTPASDAARRVCHRRGGRRSRAAAPCRSPAEIRRRPPARASPGRTRGGRRRRPARQPPLLRSRAMLATVRARVGIARAPRAARACAARGAERAVRAAETRGARARPLRRGGRRRVRCSPAGGVSARRARGRSVRARRTTMHPTTRRHVALRVARAARRAPRRARQAARTDARRGAPSSGGSRWTVARRRPSRSSATVRWVRDVLTQRGRTCGG